MKTKNSHTLCEHCGKKVKPWDRTYPQIITGKPITKTVTRYCSPKCMADSGTAQLRTVAKQGGFIL